MIKNELRTGVDHEKGGRMQLEDTSLTTDLTILEVEEIDKFLGAKLFLPLMEDIYLGLGLPRRLITDDGRTLG